MSINGFMTTLEVAEELGVHPNTVSNWRSNHTYATELPYIKFNNNSVLYMTGVVQAFKKARADARAEQDTDAEADATGDDS